MSKLVKTGQDIANDIIKDQDIDGGPCTGYGRAGKRYLVLPGGLDKLEEMLKEELEDTKLMQPIELEINVPIIVTSTFARFKKENGI